MGYRISIVILTLAAAAGTPQGLPRVHQIALWQRTKPANSRSAGQRNPQPAETKPGGKPGDAAPQPVLLWERAKDHAHAHQPATEDKAEKTKKK